MNCYFCGAELKELDVKLSEQEIEDMFFISNKEQVSQQALKMDSINPKDFSDGQIYEYFKAAFDNMAEVEFLKYMWIKNVRAKYNIPETEMFDFVNGKLYVHVNACKK